MNQKIEQKVWEEFERQQTKALKEVKNRVSNSGNPTTAWTKKITEKIKISELASQSGINKCPVCDYGIDFNDSKGWFICHKAKYDNACDFKGNIVKLHKDKE